MLLDDHPRMIEECPRYAIYFASAAESALGLFGTGVLGRDAERDVEADLFPQLKTSFPDWRSHVTTAAHYGFHATLKPPFALAAGVNGPLVREAVAALAKTLSPVVVGHLQVSAIGRFIALVPVAPQVQLETIATRIVCELDPLRVPLSAEDRARRRPERLTVQQVSHLDTWGYPYVLDEFRFHMTLTGQLSDGVRTDAERILRGLYAPFDHAIEIRDVCIFMQANRAARFTLLDRIPLGA